MNSDGERIVSDLVGGLEEAWNSADGARFAQPFAEDADFVNIRGEHLRTRDVIAKGHQAIFNTIYAAASSAIAFWISQLVKGVNDRLDQVDRALDLILDHLKNK
jgi:ketosteroid isomerase-like protein